MKKPSIYNIFIGSEETGGIIFNSLSQQDLQLSSSKWKQLVKNQKYLIDENIEKEEFALLCQKGFFVDEDIDEYLLVCSQKMRVRLDKRSYHVFVNPTLDCNLRCWYCYETHRKGSHISKKIVEAIGQHLKIKIQEDDLKTVVLSFFGGEPMMNSSKVANLISLFKDICDSKGIKLYINFTTNGTLLPNKVIDALEDIDTSFQHSDELLNDILKLPKDKIKISLQKIWQVNSDTIDYDSLFRFVKALLDKNIKVDFLEIPSRVSTACYADRLNSVVVNYNGLIYKCTARDFTEKNSVGKLENNGIIAFDYEKLKDYVFAAFPVRCRTCSLFPVCHGVCSQKVIENGVNTGCILESGFSIEDYIWFNYKYRALCAENAEKPRG